MVTGAPNIYLGFQGAAMPLWIARLLNPKLGHQGAVTVREVEA